MKTNPRIHTALLLAAASVSALHAATIRMDFNVTGFSPSSTYAPPTDPVIGSITWQAPGLGDPVQSFDSINMTIDGHTYSTGEIGYRRDTSWNFVGGTLDEVNGLSYLTDDFMIIWDANTLQGLQFHYSSADVPTIWYVTSQADFTSFSVAEVPEPATSSLAVLGLLGAWACRPRRNRK
jgi:hypothetical protein